MPFVKFQWPHSLRARLLAVYGVAMLVSALLVGSMAFFMAGPFNRYMLQYGAEDFAQNIATRAQFSADGKPTGFDEQKIETWLFTSFKEELAVRIVDPEGRAAFSPTGEADVLAPQGQGFNPAVRRFALERNGVQMHAGTAPIEHDGVTWYVQFAASDRLVLKLRDSLGTPALQHGILATCLTFLAVFLVATHLTLQRMLLPLRAASLEAQRITPQTLDARLQARDLPEELAPLIDAFNRALDRLQVGFRTQQEFLANAAHELKTPLALIRAQVELMPATQNNTYLLQDVDHMARQVQQLLHLAEASETHNYRIEEVHPLAAISEVCEYMDRIAERNGVKIAFGMRPQKYGAAAFWMADRGALFTLLKNLLENAIQHSPAGTVVTITAHRDGFSVADQGTGVHPAELDKLFHRFWRGAARRDKGAGLGLSICQEITNAHQWQIEARPGAVGLEVRVRFPSADGRAQNSEHPQPAPPSPTGH